MKKVNLKIVQLFILKMYIFFSITAQESLLPPGLTSFSLYALLGMTVFRCIVAKRIEFTRHTVWIVSLTALSLVYSITVNYNLSNAIEKMVVILIVSFCVINSIDSKDAVIDIIKVYSIAGGVLVVLLLVTNQLFTTQRLGYSLMGNANSFSNMLMVSTVFTEWCLLYQSKFQQKIIYGTSFVMQIIALLLSGGRKTVGIAMICFLVFVLSRGRGNIKKWMWNALILAIVFAAVYYMITSVPVFYNMIGKRIFERTTGTTGDIASDNMRIYMVQLALQGWLEAPILGHGIDTFKYLNRSVTGNFFYSHNNYAEMLYDFGAVGFILYYGFIVRMLFMVRSVNIKFQPYKALCLGVIVEFLFFDLGGISYFTIENQIAIALAYITLVLHFIDNSALAAS